MRVAPTITLTDEKRMELTKLVRSKRTSVRLAERLMIDPFAPAQTHSSLETQPKLQAHTVLKKTTSSVVFHS